MKYRKKPVIVDAVQYNGPAEQNYPSSRVLPDGVTWHCYGGQDLMLYPVIHTLEGRMLVSPGDWIITGVKGEKYPCKPDIFEMTYEKVNNDSQEESQYEKA